MRYFLFYSLFFALTLPLLAQDSSGQFVIEDPSIKKVCNELTAKREEKIEHKKSLIGLLKKTHALQTKLESKQKKVQTNIQRLSDKITFEIKVTEGKIESLAEKIIRSGCPPIDLADQKLDEIATQDIVNNLRKEKSIDEIDLKSIEEEASTLLP